MNTADAIVRTLESETVPDRRGEGVNVVDAISSLAYSTRRVADAITPNICGGHDAAGGHVESLTEAVMGVTGGLVQIASAISNLAEAIREHG